MSETSWAVYWLCSIAVLLATLAISIHRKSRYWKRRGVPSIGDFKSNILLKEFFGDSLRKHHEKYKHLRFTGSFHFGRPILVIHDPELIKEMFVQHFSDFGGSGSPYDAKRDPLSANLLLLSGHEWKTMRTQMSPAFTSGKIKYMFETVLDRILQLERYLGKKVSDQGYVVENVRELVARLATDVILSVTLGILSDSVENPDAEFRAIGKAMFVPSVARFLREAALRNKTIVETFNVLFAPKAITDFFINAINDAVDYREKNNVTRNDFLDLMIRLKKYGTLTGERGEPQNKETRITNNEIAAQAFIFFLAGFETTSSTTSYALFEIAKHPEIQRKMQAEIDAALKASGEKITYETVLSLQYTDMVIQESQRLHPAAGHLERATLRACTIPTTSIELEKDTFLVVPIRALHHDPDLFPNPDVFNPDRFSPQNLHSIPQHAFIPFGVGPRLCIGKRFAMVQVKATILSLLSKYDVELADGTPTTLEYEPRLNLPTVKFPLNLKITPRSNASILRKL